MRRSATLLIAAATAQAVLLSPQDGDAGRMMLVTGTPPSSASCLGSSFYGAYGGSASDRQYIYMPEAACLWSDEGLDSFTAGSLVPLDAESPKKDSRIVWVGQAGLDPAIIGDAEIGGIDASWSVIQMRAEILMADPTQSMLGGRSLLSGEREGQMVFAQPDGTDIQIEHTDPIRLLHKSDTSMLLDVPMSYVGILDTILPPHLVPVALPTKPLPSSLEVMAGYADAAVQGWLPVPEKLAADLANITKHLKFSSELDTILAEGIDVDEIRRNVRWLTGEGPSGIETRHSFSSGAKKAAHWLKDKVEATGATCELYDFLPGFAPDVICTYPSAPFATAERVILSAHYDSRGSFGMTRAPGADDDASGSSHVLAVAEAIKSQNVRFMKKVTLAFFAGEEQGLYGSHALAEKMHNEKEPVVFQLQADMLAYHVPGEPLQLGLPESIGLPEAAYLVGNLSALYSPELLVGRSAACCSDHQSFVSYGFPATQVFERNGPIADPMYHNSGDLSQREGYDFDQVASIAKVTMASILSVAGYTIAA